MPTLQLHQQYQQPQQQPQFQPQHPQQQHYSQLPPFQPQQTQQQQPQFQGYQPQQQPQPQQSVAIGGGKQISIPSFAPPTPTPVFPPQTPPGLAPSLTPMGSPAPMSPTGGLRLEMKPKLEYTESASMTSGKVVHTSFLLQRQPVLDSLWDLQRTQNTQLELVRAKQKQLFLAPEKNLFEEVYRLQVDLRNRVDAELRAVEQLYQNTVLTLGDLNKWLSLRHQFAIQSSQLDLYQRELLQLTEHKAGGAQCFATLAMTERPASSVIFKGKHFGQPYVVHLLTGANVDLTCVSKVKASIVCESHLWKGKVAKKSMNEDTKVIELHQHVVQFQPKFLVGTRKNAVNLRFSVAVRSDDAVHTIESDLSNPFIVITNECQWAEAEGTLIKKEAFGGHLEIPWARFANVFHMHFIRATRQDVNKPARAFHAGDFEYLHDKFFGNKQMVSYKDFDQFWSWFGKGLHILRYQRHVGNLWKSGLVYGFIAKDAVHRALSNERPGSFLVRFSENHAGSFAVAYKHIEEVKHYLVKPDDIAGPKKTLPDFLQECPQFVYVLRLAIDPDGRPLLTSHRKDAVLDPFLSHRPSVSAPGYDELPHE